MIKKKVSVNAANFIEFLTEFQRLLITNAGRKIVLIVDLGPAHRANKAGAFVHGRFSRAQCAERLLRSVSSQLSGQLFRVIGGGDVASDAFIAILGVLLMGFIAWAAEWRERLRAALAKKPPSP